MFKGVLWIPWSKKDVYVRIVTVVEWSWVGRGMKRPFSKVFGVGGSTPLLSKIAPFEKLTQFETLRKTKRTMFYLVCVMHLDVFLINWLFCALS